MNHETTVKRIQGLVPSIMDLELKCSECDGDGFTDGHDIPQSHSEDGECLSCPVKVDCDICRGTGILGKPITISVVLIALNESKNVWVGFELRETQLSVLEYWNFSKDNFHDQSEETKEFIGELLTD